MAATPSLPFCTSPITPKQARSRENAALSRIARRDSEDLVETMAVLAASPMWRLRCAALLAEDEPEDLELAILSLSAEMYLAGRC